MALFAALLLAAPPLGAAREAETLPPSLEPAAAPFSFGPNATLLIVRVYSSAARDDEFVEVGNARSDPFDLAGWSLTDGEASAIFPADSVVPAGGRLLITRNSTSYREDTLAAADFTFEKGEARRMEGGVPRLADSGDEIFLLNSNGSVVDGYVWGDSPYDGPGWIGRPAEKMGRGEIAVRIRDANAVWLDREVAEDWEGLRRYRLGQSAFEFDGFELTSRRRRRCLARFPRIRARDDRSGRVHFHERTNRIRPCGCSPPRSPRARAAGWRPGRGNRRRRGRSHARTGQRRSRGSLARERRGRRETLPIPAREICRRRFGGRLDRVGKLRGRGIPQWTKGQSRLVGGRRGPQSRRGSRTGLRGGFRSATPGLDFERRGRQ